MCTTCGCDDSRADVGSAPHAHGNATHTHDHAHEPSARVASLEIDLLAKNDRLAAGVRARLASAGITAFNVLGSPGAGKTALLERLVGTLGVPVSVIEGDQATDRDAARIRDAGAPVLQINTGTGCHLDAHMIDHALDALAPEQGSVVFVENVGNLVCPALFDLGERRKVLVMSVTEGDDKPLKYPHMFRAADALVLGKIDLLPHVDFDVDRCVANARRMRSGLPVFPLSATRGEGLEPLRAWLLDEARAAVEGGASRSRQATNDTGAR